jgi:ABC-type lipoprotein release transport system permease subunit
MRAAAGLVCRVEVRRRWASLLALAVITAVVSVAVLTAAVGARRAVTAVDRYRDGVGASDASFQTMDPSQVPAITEAVRSTGNARATGTRYLVNAFAADPGRPDIAIMSDPDGHYGTTIDRPLMLQGRLPRPDAPDEVMLNELAARLTGLRVGDLVRLRTWSDSDLAALGGGAFPGFNGPPLELRVVGIGRVPEEVTGEVRRTGAFAVASPAFLAGHPGIGAWPPAVFVRFDHGADDVPAATRAVSRLHLIPTGGDDEGAYQLATTATDVYQDGASRAVRSQAVGLSLFALGALLAGAVAVGQAVNRQLAGAVVSGSALSTFGLTGREAARVTALPISMAGVGGILIGAVAAVLASPLLPFGLARRVELEPGITVAPAVLVPGTIVLSGVLVAWVLGAAARTVVAAPAGRHRRPSLAGRLLRAGAPVAIVTGVRLAADRGRGRGAVPVRSAFAGVAIGLAGILAAGVMATSFHQVETHPASWGWTWSSMPDYFGDDDPDSVTGRLAADRGLDAVGSYTTGSVVLDGSAMTGATLTAARGTLAPTLVRGRLPSSPDQVALGEETRRRHGVALGGRVRAADTGGGRPHDLEVVGTVLIPSSGGEYTVDVGAFLTADGLTAVQQGDPTSSMVLRYPTGSDRAKVEARLQRDYGLSFTTFARAQVPGSLRIVGESRDVAVAIGAFFAALAAVGLFHALVVSTRRRRADLGVLQALGLRRRAVRVAVLSQSTFLAVAGAAVGIPVGLVVGRAAWRALVQGTGAVAGPVTPWWFLAVALAGTLLAAVLLAAWPARVAARRSPADALRSE